MYLALEEDEEDEEEDEDGVEEDDERGTMADEDKERGFAGVDSVGAASSDFAINGSKNTMQKKRGGLRKRYMCCWMK